MRPRSRRGTDLGAADEATTGEPARGDFASEEGSVPPAAGGQPTRVHGAPRTSRTGGGGGGNRCAGTVALARAARAAMLPCGLLPAAPAGDGVACPYSMDCDDLTAGDPFDGACEVNPG